ncbi:uncharacterized protein LOC127745446 [Arachis duranensis]|uniref:Uncharacterized protein LOC127745446 n=1 Tax=Arachis duranensis TaxID=130453 RepID=A0A9C6WTJ5_ARADU|nr:uncharacterized protein LOC127745446 [Arachis duranensis]
MADDLINLILEEDAHHLWQKDRMKGCQRSLWDRWWTDSGDGCVADGIYETESEGDEERARVLEDEVRVLVFPTRPGVTWVVWHWAKTKKKKTQHKAVLGRTKKKKTQNHPQSHSLRHSQLHLTHRTSQRFPLRHSHLSRSQHGYRRSSLVTLLAGSSAASPHRQCLLASASSAPVPPPFVSSRPPWLRRASAVSTSASSLVSVQHLPSACTLHDKQRVIG